VHKKAKAISEPAYTILQLNLDLLLKLPSESSKPDKTGGRRRSMVVGSGIGAVREINVAS
jgi:hypothetical protein